MKSDQLELLYQQAIDKAVALAFLNEDGEFLHVNDLFLEITKFERSDLISNKVTKIISNFPFEQVSKKDDCFILKSNQEIELNYCFYNINQTVKCLKINEVYQNKMHQKMEQVLSKLDATFWGWNLLTNEAWFDENWPRMLGYEKEEIRKNIDAWTEFAHPEDQERTIAEMNYHIKFNTPSAIIIQRFKHKDGHWIRVLTNGKVVDRDQDGRPLRFVGINTDISKIKNFEEFSPEIQDMADTGTWEIEIEGMKKRWSRKTFEIFENQHLQEPPSNEEIMQVYEPVSSEKAKQATADLIENSQDYDIDLKLKNGKWIRLVGRTEQAHRKAYKAYGIIQDISKRKKAEENLLKSQETLQLALKAGEFGVWEWDLKEQSIYCSPSMKVLFSEAESENYKYQDLIKIIHEEDRTKILEEINLLKDVTEKFDFTYRIKKLHSWRWVRSIANVRKDENSKVQNLISITWDITKQIEIQERQKQIIEQAEHNSEMKSRFMATVSHEIRTPMSGIIGMTELLAESDLSAEQRETVQTVKICAENLLTLVNDILDYSKLEANKLQLDKRPFKLADTIKNTIDLFAYKARQKQINILYELDPNISEFIVQDEARVYQVLFNLIGNAVKFTTQGEIKVSVKQVGSHLKFQVIDSGIGIPKNKQHLIFESFTQLNPGIVTESYGTGLGLSISRSIVELMGGEINVESEVNKGSTFTFDISISNKSHFEPKQEIKETQRAKSDLSNMKVLVVEDNPINIKLITAILDKIGVQVDTAEDGLVAVEKVKRHDYHLIFMDVQMPKLDGQSATRRIRSMEGRETIPYIVALTANVTNDHKEECLQSGMDDFLPKPIRVQVIRSLIDSYSNRFDLSEKPKEDILAPGHLKLIDTNRLELDFEGFDDLLAQFIDIFIKNYSTYLQQIDTSISQGDFQEVAKVAHTFKGIISNFQSKEIRTNIEELERLAKDEDLNGLKSCFNLTTSLVSKLVIEINELNKKFEK